MSGAKMGVCLMFIFLLAVLVRESAAECPCAEGTCEGSGPGSGTCILDKTAANGYKCKCADEYTGDNCEITLCTQAEADLEDCKNNGICEKHGSSYETIICNCPAGYEGPKCETAPCDTSPCMNGGSCTVDSNAASGYTCDCPLGYFGVDCEFQPCGSSPCQNSGTCTAVSQNAFTCACTAGFTGALCEAQICDENEPDFLNCKNGGTCIVQSGGYVTTTCSCPPGYIGVTCEEPTCSPDPCAAGEVCTVGISSFSCACDPATECVGSTCSNCPQWLAKCPAYKSNKRLGMCYQNNEEPQHLVDPPAPITGNAIRKGLSFIVYGKSKLSKRYWISHLSSYPNGALSPHKYSATVEIRFKHTQCDELVATALDKNECLDDESVVTITFSQVPERLVDLVTQDVVDRKVTVNAGTSTMECTVKFTRVLDLRRYPLNGVGGFGIVGGPPDGLRKRRFLPQEPVVHWLIFSNRNIANREDTRFYMEKIPRNCFDTHEWFEIEPKGEVARDLVTEFLFDGRRAGVVTLKKGSDPIIRVHDSPIEPGIFSAVSLEKDENDQKLYFQLRVIRVIARDPNIAKGFDYLRLLCSE